MHWRPISINYYLPRKNRIIDESILAAGSIQLHICLAINNNPSANLLRNEYKENKRLEKQQKEMDAPFHGNCNDCSRNRTNLMDNRNN